MFPLRHRASRAWSPPQPQARNLRVLDLASTGKTALGYDLFWRQCRVDLKSIDQKEPAAVPPLSRVNWQFQQGQLPQALSAERRSYYDHVHFHLLDGLQADRKLAASIFNEVHTVLRTGGIFFFSFDSLFFKPSPASFGRDGLVRGLLNLLSDSGLAPLYTFFNPHTWGDGREQRYLGPSRQLPPPVCSESVADLEAQFGERPIRSQPLIFLSNFSDFLVWNSDNGPCAPSFILCVKEPSPGAFDLKTGRST